MARFAPFWRILPKCTLVQKSLVLLEFSGVLKGWQEKGKSLANRRFRPLSHLSGSLEHGGILAAAALANKIRLHLAPDGASSQELLEPTTRARYDALQARQ